MVHTISSTLGPQLYVGRESNTQQSNQKDKRQSENKLSEFSAYDSITVQLMSQTQKQSGIQSVSQSIFKPNKCPFIDRMTVEYGRSFQWLKHRSQTNR